MADALEELKSSLKNLIAVQVNLVTTVQESITAVAKVLEALDSDSLMASTATTNAAIASTNVAIQHANIANSQLQVSLPPSAGGAGFAPTPAPVSAPVSAGESAPKLAVAMFPYQGEQSSDLSFETDDQIVVLKEDPSGWWYGECKGQTGLFPKNFVTVVGPSAGAGLSAGPALAPRSSSIGTSPTPKSKSPSPVAARSPTGSMTAEYRSGRKYRVLFDYDAETEEELTIREGQIVAVLNESDGYYKGINQEGQVGKFPSIFVAAAT